jgi:multicomponent Na+:H+ antiporter subunit E
MKAAFFNQYLILVSVLFLLWILLTGSMAFEELLTGFIVAIVAAIATSRIALFDGLKLTLASPLALFKYLVHFFIALLKANLDLARRILSPSLLINPAMVEIRTELKSDLGKLLLANSITLTPGTLAVDIQQDRILVHWIDVSSATDLEHATRIIAGGFEQHIRGFLK